ncbi:PREDICTED: sialic acid-binding Ig-like lectin 12, partial [Ceratotherium simum simum]|uniref:Sialic acid-binding Ig-like lectin 12 n=1 Tax=Ceratotherium simum simum TaxID=73337 RepID=A0ABM1DMM3_CERSS
PSVSSSPAPTALKNGSSLAVLEGQSLRLVCVVDSNPPARLSWAHGSQTLSPSQPFNPGVLDLPRVESKHEGEFTCQAQHPGGSLHVSLSLSLQRKAWPLSGVVLGAVGGAGATALLFLSFCVIVIIVRSGRKKAARPAEDVGDAGMEGENTVAKSVSQVSDWVSLLPASCLDASPRVTPWIIPLSMDKVVVFISPSSSLQAKIHYILSIFPPKNS